MQARTEKDEDVPLHPNARQLSQHLLVSPFVVNPLRLSDL